ncbi:hypothetical protein MLD38_016070 [Melastoma candidum]|uniref:Uncharacterized protein n=1 Tax=Melastoma candidum TaxID=119954 RepID=A0ACB9RI28_9MYRT|nr:hypothetical protein MLD38_016070 [Melastoma candidum]
MGRGDPHHHPGRNVLDPVLIGILGILAGALVVAAYHCIGANISLRRRQLEERSRHHQVTRQHPRRQRPAHDAEPSQATPGQPGRVFVYGKGSDGKRSYEERTCAVCLGEYEDGELIRALPGCLHAFHAACVDTWLSSHASCPLCRGCTEPQPNASNVAESSGVVESRGGGEASE